MILKVKRPKDWIIEEKAWEPQRNEVWESIFTLSNGYIGVRGFPEESFDAGPSSPGIFIAGVFAKGADMIPVIAGVTNFLAVEIMLEEENFRMSPGKVGEYLRVLDLKRGLLQRSMIYSSGGHSTRIEFERFASLAHPHRVSQSVSITPLGWSGKVSVSFWMDADVSKQRNPLMKFLHSQHMGRDRILLATVTERTGIRIAHACRCTSWVSQVPPPKARMVGSKVRIGFRYDVFLENGQRATFDRVTSTYSSIDPDITSVERCCLEDVRGIAEMKGVVYGVRRRRHVDAWSRRWEQADIVIDGPTEDQLAVRFAIFHLLQICPVREMFAGIGAKGLSGRGYGGHVFWDTEIFMLPFYVSMEPIAAKRILQYRYHTLDGAQRKAGGMGYEGAMFAWESADTGDETCPPYVPDPKTGAPVRVLTGELQHHVSADVVYAAWHYVLATGDTYFQEKELLTLSVLTARFWASRAEFIGQKSRYEIRNVIGPDEYHEKIDNNAYTNHMAYWNLKIAAEQADRMFCVHRRSRLLRVLGVSKREIQEWNRISENLYLPRSRADGVVEQHDGFFSLKNLDPKPLSAVTSRDPEKVRMKYIHQAQVLKQADVIMLMVLMPELFPDNIKEANWNYYEPRTTHDSSLSPSIHSIAASHLGLKEKAYSYFRQSAFTDLHDNMLNADSGLHFAAMGGTWQAVVKGFLGLNTDNSVPTMSPRLPDKWKKVSMRIVHRNMAYDIEVTHDTVKIQPYDPI